MPRFSYRAKDTNLKLVEGTIEADTESSAISRLGSQGIFPISVVQISGSQSASARGFFSRRISQQTLAHSTQQLADLLGGGLPLLSALTLLSKQTEHLELRRVIESMASSVREGRSFSEALTEHPNVFPPLYRSMARAGEISGSLENSLARLAELGEREAELRSHLRSAAAYPTFILCMAVAMTVFLMAYVIPKLSLVFIETGQLLPAPTRILLQISAVFTQWWWAILLGLIVLVFIVRRWYASSGGHALVDRSLLVVPAFGDLVRKWQIARFTRGLGTMIAQGVPILQALDVVGRNVSNAVMRRSIRQAQEEVRDGASLEVALSATAQFPVFVSNMVAVGEESGRVDAALLKIAASYDREVDRAMRTLTSILEPILLVAVGGVVMFIVLAMLLPIFQIGLVVE